MGSSYFGEPNMGNNERVSGSSSRKGKKNNQDKPKQPQRGLGVAQLEKIRLHGQMAYGFHPLHQGSFPSNLNNVNLSTSLAPFDQIKCIFGNPLPFLKSKSIRDRSLCW